MRIKQNNKDIKTEYIQKLFATEDKLLTKIKEDAIAINRPINITPDEGKLLQLLVKLSKSNKILEIGTFYGYSTIWIARALSYEGIIYTIEKEIDNYSKAKSNFIEAKLDKKIKLIKGEAEYIIDKMYDVFDMIFIDADKINYLNYLDWTDKNLKNGGLIVADNTLLSGAVYMKELPYRIRKSTMEIMKKFNKRLSDSSKYTSILLPSTDGITIAIKN